MKNLKNKSIALATTMLVASNAGLAFAQGDKIMKDETVYSILDENGDVKKNIVSDWINSDATLGNVKDVSKLTNIKNIKGDEAPTIDGDKVSWNIDKEDLYYQGETNKELPIDVDIKYELNGERVSPEEVKGKSGDFKIIIKLKNNSKKTVTIDSKSRVIYTPFLATGEILLNRDNFKNIKISSGLMLDEGSNASISFVSLPGLDKSLNLTSSMEKYLDLKDEIVIEGDTVNFEVPTIMFAVTSDIVSTLEDIDADMDFSELKDSLDKLKDGGEDLVDGAKKIAEGSEDLNSKYTLFDNGVKKLDSSIATLQAGADTMVKKLPELTKGTGSLSEGIEKINLSQNKFATGVKTYVENAGKLEQAYGSIDNGIGSLYSGSKQLNSGLKTLGSGVDSLIGSTQKVDELGDSIMLISNKISSNDSSKVKTQIESLAQRALMDGDKELASQIVELGKSLESQSQSLAKASENLDSIGKGLKVVSEKQRDGLGTVKSGVKNLGAGANTLEGGLLEVNKGSNLFSMKLGEFAGAGSVIKDSSVKLSAATNDAYKGSKQLSEATKVLETGANELTSGVSMLKEGSSTLSDNSTKILAGISTLSNGTNDLYSGASKLKTEGLDELNNQGQELISEIDNISEVKDELIKAAEDYNNFSGIDDSMSGRVRFVLKVDSEENKNINSIESEKQQNQEEKEQDKKGIWDFIKNLFNK